LRLLGVEVATGLAADEVARRQKEYGPNRSTARRGTPAWLKFLRQFNPGSSWRKSPKGYRLFGEKSDGVLKVAIKP